jgi:hypothetical protein
MIDEVTLNSRYIDWQARRRGNWDSLATYIAVKLIQLPKRYVLCWWTS